MKKAPGNFRLPGAELHSHFKARLMLAASFMTSHQ
jgi:hypothetical protein